MSGSWLAGWATNDIVTAAEFRKGMGMIADSTLGAPAGSIDFSALPTSYGALLIEAQLRGDTAATFTNVNLRFNADAGVNYNYGQISTNGTTVATTEQYGQVSIIPGVIPAATAPTSAGGPLMVLVPNYGGTTFHKNTLSLVASNNADAGPNQMNMAFGQGRWKSTAAITRVTLLPSAGSFVAGSRMTIWAQGV